MHAADIAEQFPTVREDTDALEAVKQLAVNRLPALIVVDASGNPYTILSASEVVTGLVPSYVRDDPSLAGVFTESMSDQLTSKLVAKTVGDLLPEPPIALPTVEHDDTLLQVAATIAGSHHPFACVRGCQTPVAVITASRLLEHALHID